MKIDKYHYHEFIHACSIVCDMIEDHLIGHHVGDKYKNDLEKAQLLIYNAYNVASSDSDKLFKDNKG